MKMYAFPTYAAMLKIVLMCVFGYLLRQTCVPIDFLAVTILGLIIMFILFVHELLCSWLTSIRLFCNICVGHFVLP